METRNLNHAATLLNVTQSTVSARLNSLEDELGQALFQRKKSGAELTAAGFKFERYARLMTDLWRQAKQETALPSKVEYVCNFGCHPDIWTSLGRDFFQHARRLAPNAALSIWQGEQDNLNRWLSTGLIDASLCYSPNILENAVAKVLRHERLILVSNIKRKLMRWDPEYIYVDYGEGFRQKHAAAYPDGDTPMTVFNSPIWALDHLSLNGGSAYLPERMIKKQLLTSQLFQVKDAPEFIQSIYIVSNTEMTKSWKWMPQLLNHLNRE